MEELVKITWDHMIVFVKLDGPVNIVKIVNIVNQIPVKMVGHVFQHLVDINVCVIDTKEKIVTNLIHATQIHVRTVDNAVTSMEHLLVRANHVTLEISVKRTTVQIVISMLTVLTDIVSVALVTKVMVNKDARKRRRTIKIHV